MIDYKNDWATAALLQQYLRNSRKGRKVQRTAKDKGKARARFGPINLDDAMDTGDDDDDEHTHSDSGEAEVSDSENA